MRGLQTRLDGGLAELVAGPAVGPVRFFRGTASDSASRTRARLGAGRGRGLVEGPAVHSRHHRRPPRRRSRSPRPSSPGLRRSAPPGSRWRDYQAQRDRCALPMHPIVDRLASHEWDLTEARRLLRALSSVMADEVEAIRACRSRVRAYPPDGCCRHGLSSQLGGTMRVEIDLLGGFAVRVDGRPVPAGRVAAPTRGGPGQAARAGAAPDSCTASRSSTRCGPITDSTTPRPGCTRPRTTPGARSATRGRSSSPGTPCRCSRTPT